METPVENLPEFLIPESISAFQRKLQVLKMVHNKAPLLALASALQIFGCHPDLFNISSLPSSLLPILPGVCTSCSLCQANFPPSHTP